MQFALFRTPRVRNPLVRLLFAAIGLVVLAGVLAFGLFAAAVAVVVGGVMLLMRQFTGTTTVRTAASPPPMRPAEPGAALEGEFIVVSTKTGRSKS